MASREEIERKINDRYAERRLSGSPYHAYWASIVVMPIIEEKEELISTLDHQLGLKTNSGLVQQKEIEELRKLNNEHLQEIAKRGSQINELKEEYKLACKFADKPFREIIKKAFEKLNSK